MRLIISTLVLSFAWAPTYSIAGDKLPETTHKTAARALCETVAESTDSKSRCYNEANRIQANNFYDIALQICVGAYATNARSVAECLSAAGRRVDSLGAGYERNFSQKIIACENRAELESATQNDVVGCQKEHFEANARNFARPHHHPSRPAIKNNGAAAR